MVRPWKSDGNIEHIKRKKMNIEHTHLFMPWVMANASRVLENAQKRKHNPKIQSIRRKFFFSWPARHNSKDKTA